MTSRSKKNTKNNTFPQRLVISTAVAAALISGYGSRRAYAGSCTGGAGTFTCSGAAGADTTQTLNSGTNLLSVTTTAGFGINTATGSALKLTNSVGGTSINFTDTNTSLITGASYGIYAKNNGTGTTSITSTGMVTGTTNHGIYANNRSTTTGLTISTAAVTGAYNGIFAFNTGKGAISITSTGTVTGGAGNQNYNGIQAFNSSSNSSNLTISTAAVTGGGTGISATNTGTGATSITSSGAVTGTSGNGIYAYSRTSTTGLTINTAAVTGGYRGIFALNYGKGATSITTTGMVTGGANFSGIHAVNQSNTTSLTINTAAVSSGVNAIFARNSGAGATSITVNGAVTGGTGVGISSMALNGNTITLNSGASVSATSGNAITMSGGGTNSVNVNSGASVTGSVDLGGASNIMTLNGGTLNVANGFALNVLGSLINTNGIINLRNSTIGAPATISGNFTGGGQLLLNANFATNTADKLIITGNVLAGGTRVGVNDISTGPATGTAITLVSVGGTTTTADFTLAAPVARGAYNYNTLALVGHDWVLQSVAPTPTPIPTPSVSPAYTPFAGSFEAMGQSLLMLSSLPTLVERTHGRIGGTTTGANSGDGTAIDTPIWLRFAGGYRNIDSNSSSTGANFDTKHWQAQVGIDFTVADNANGRFVAGVNAGYHQADTNVTSTAGKSNLDTTGHGIGLSGTWYGVNGVYVDTQLQRNWYDTDLSAGGVGAGKVNGIGSDGYSASIEVGKEIALNNSLSVVPQAQLIYSTVDTDNFTGANAEIVKLSKGKSLKARLGAALNKQFTEDGATHGFVLANVIREFKDETQVNVSGADLANAVDRWSGELGLGLTHAWTKGSTSYELTGQVTGSTSLNNLGNSTAAQGGMKFKVNF